jgi:hypothetical protein
LVAEQDERSITFKAVRGDQVKTLGQFTLHQPMYRGVYKAGDQYRLNESVTYRGDLWIARADTFDTPGEGKTHCTLAVRKGRDGRERRGED